MTDWLEHLHDQLGNGTEALRAALDDVARMCGGSPAPTAWLDASQPPHLNVYVLHDGLVHVLAGKRDEPAPVRSSRDPEPAAVETEVRWRGVPVRPDATCCLTVRRVETAREAPCVHHTWRFRITDPDHPIDLEIAWSLAADTTPPAADPTAFADALLLEILRARRKAAR